MLLMAVYLLISTTSYGQGGDVVGLFTGQQSVPIPIHELKGKNISIPINLVYSSDGIKVEEHSSWVGMGWNLSAGGVITRIIHKFPDEVFDSVDGFINPNTWKSENVMKRTDWARYGLELTGNAGEELPKYYKYVAEYFDEPDEYFFNFLGYSGRFYIDDRGEIRIQSTQNFKIERNGWLPGFDVYDEKGNHYQFVDCESTLVGNRKEPSYITTSWALKSVSSADHFDSFVFDYEIGPFTAQITKKDRAYGGGIEKLVWDNEVEFKQSKYLKSIIYNDSKEVVFSSSKSEEYTYPSSLYRACKFDGEIIDTTFLNNRSSPYWRDKSMPVDVYQRILWLKLDRVSLKENGKTVKNINFIYNNNSTQRLFLDSLIIKDGAESFLGKYLFAYKNKALVPKYLEVVGDHWGYNNGMNYGIYANNFETRKEVNETFLQDGILQSITFPTGGRAEYEYEINNYSKVVNDQNRAQVTPLIGKASGLRIKSIKTFDSESASPKSEKQFVYKSNYLQLGEDAPSSGVLNALPRYLPVESEVGEFEWYGRLCKPATPLTLNNDGQCIGYSEVTIRSLGSSGKLNYTVVQYTNHDNGYADIYPDYIVNGGELQYKHFTSRSFERGNMLTSTQYNSNKEIVSNESYIWERLGDPYTNGIRCLYFFTKTKPSYIPLLRKLQGAIVSDAGCAFRYLTYPFVLSKKITTEYLGGSSTPIIGIKSFEYSYVDSLNLCLLKRIQTNASSGDVLSTVFTYPLEILKPLKKYKSSNNLYLDDYLRGIEEMERRYMIGLPIEIVNKVHSGGEEKLVSAENCFRMVEDVNSASYVDEVKVFKPSRKVVDYAPILVSTSERFGAYYSSLISDSRCKTVSKNMYNKNGMLLESTGKDGVVKSYLWDTHNKIPVVETTNIRQNQISDLILGSCKIQHDNYTNNERCNIISNIYGKVISSKKIKSAFNITRVNKAGDVLSVSDHLGNMLNYKYDNAGNVRYVTNKNDEITEYNESKKHNGQISTMFEMSDNNCLAAISDLTFTCEGGTKSFLLENLEGWSVRSNVGWIVVEKVADVLLIKCNMNETYYEGRLGQITITSSKGTKVVNITQNQRIYETTYLNYDAQPQQEIFDLSMLPGWTIYRYDRYHYLKVSKDNNLLKIDVDDYYEDPVNGERSATVEINYKGNVIKFIITQTPEDPNNSLN